MPTPRSWADEVYPDLVFWYALDRGGHFASLGEPMLFVRELRAFGREVR